MKMVIKNKMKLIVTIILGLLTVGLVLLRALGDRIEGFKDIELLYNNLIPIAIALCFILSMLFFKFTKKKLLLTIFLLLLVAVSVSLSFLKPEQLEYTINYKVGEEEKSTILALADILFLTAQLALVVYTLFVVKGVGLKIISVAVRVAISAVACVVMQNYFEIALPQILYLISLANLVCTMLFLLFDLKNNWLLCLGVLLLTVAVCLMAFKTGQLAAFSESTGDFVDFLRTKEVETWFFVAGTFLTASSSVFSEKAGH